MTENFIPNKKVFVFDTNVILHDFKSIFSFEETNRRKLISLKKEAIQSISMPESLYENLMSL